MPYVSQHDGSSFGYEEERDSYDDFYSEEDFEYKQRTAYEEVYGRD